MAATRMAGRGWRSCPRQAGPGLDPVFITRYECPVDPADATLAVSEL